MRLKFLYISTLILFTTIGVKAQFGAKFSVVSDVGCAPFTVSVIDSSGAPPGNVNVYNYGEVATVTQDTFYTYTTPGIYRINQLVPNGNPRDTSLFVQVVEPSTPRFNLSNCKGAEGFFHGDDTLYNAFYVDWGDGNAEIILNHQIQQHVYPALGSYNVLVQGMMDPNQNQTELANMNCSSTMSTLNLIADIIPGTIDIIEVLNQNSIQLDFSIDPNTSYYLEISQNGSSNFTTIDTFSINSLPSNYIINNLNTNANFYCFRLTAFDPCDGSTNPSAVACSVLLDGTAINNQNLLDWSTLTIDMDRFDIERDSSYLNSTTGITYSDGDVQCGIEYCYRVILNENNGLISSSNLFCIEANSIDQPPSITNITATIDDNTPILSWDMPSAQVSAYYITRTEQGGSGNETFISLSNTFADSTANPSLRQYYYDIFYEDLCGNLSASVTSSPVFLSLYLTNTIHWSRYLGWMNNVNTYFLETYDQDFQLIDDFEIGMDTVFTESNLPNIPQVLNYRIRALPSVSGLQPVVSNFLKVTFPSTVVFPNAFTPNGDGLNDIFTYKGLYITEFKMTIFNHWGELIFYSENPDTGWDGTRNSILMPSGMYIFNAEFTDQAGISFVKKGEVYLLR